MVIISVYLAFLQGITMDHFSHDKNNSLFTAANRPGCEKIGNSLKSGWAEVFRKQIYPYLPVFEVSKLYCKNNGAPSKDLSTMLGLLVLQEVLDYTDQEILEALSHDQRIQWALIIDEVNDKTAYCALRTYQYFKKRVSDNDLVKKMVDDATQSLIKANGVDTSNLRMDLSSYSLQHEEP
jgi:hypothetical protein